MYSAKPNNVLAVLFVTLHILKLSSCFVDPISFVISTSMLTSLYYFLSSPSSDPIKDSIKSGANTLCRKIGYCEDCEDYWINSNINGLDVDLKSSLFGQPLAIEIILSSLRYHLKSKRSEPSRPLMLSFQGSAGTGKNYVAEKIFKHMFRKGRNSEYVHFFRSSIDFPIKEKKEEYQNKIFSLVLEKNLKCRRSIFVFDEVEKMPNGILEALSGVVEHNTFNNYDFRRTIFILISNTGQDVILAETMKALQSGLKREDIDSSTLQQALSMSAFNENGGLHRTGLIKNLGISHYVPFLPLEEQDVINCIKYFINKEKQYVTDELVQQTLEQLTFRNMFAYAGCKGVQEKVGYLIERELMRARRKGQTD